MKAHLRRKVLVTILFLACLVAIPVGVFAAEDWRVLQARPTGGGLVSTGGDYQLAGAIGQADAGRLTGLRYRVNGGVMAEFIRIGMRPTFLPLAYRFYPPSVYETEPNDYYSQANVLETLPVRVLGYHDGTAGSGDVYQVALMAGDTMRIVLLTQNASGVQLLAYGSGGLEVMRDFDAPYSLSFTAQADGFYYLYVYSSPADNNVSAYVLSVWSDRGNVAQASIPVTVMDAEQFNQAPVIAP